jgi:hypothetical protein
LTARIPVALLGAKIFFKLASARAPCRSLCSDEEARHAFIPKVVVGELLFTSSIVRGSSRDDLSIEAGLCGRFELAEHTDINFFYWVSPQKP